MNHRLRQRHFYTFIILILILPLLVIAGLAARRLPQPIDRFPAALTTETPEPSGTFVDLSCHWTGQSIATRIIKRESMMIELNVLQTIQEPDLLLYWNSEPSDDTSLPTQSHLLGSLANTGITRFPISSQIVTNGYLLIYSLGHQEVISSTRYEP